MVRQQNGFEERARQLSAQWAQARDNGTAKITTTTVQSDRNAVDVVPIGSVTRLAVALSQGFKVAGLNKSSTPGVPPSDLVMVK